MENVEMDLTDKTQLLQYLKQHGIWANKGLSQNFLINRGALEKIVDCAELNSEDSVIEVGPGVGTLTTELVQKASKVIAIEKDEKLAQLLNCYIAKLLENNETIKQFNNKINLLKGDILQINIPELVGENKYKVVANIPYAITSKIIKLFLTQKNKPNAIVLLVQKEVAERIVATPGEMSVLAISVQLFGSPEIVDIVPKESFFPSPKVDSAILKIKIEGSKLKVQEEKEFFRLVNIGFSSKRKKLINNLVGGYHLDRKNVFDIIKKIGLSSDVRAQELSIENWIELLKYIP